MILSENLLKQALIEFNSKREPDYLIQRKRDKICHTEKKH